jgi:periplasmic protein TonB
MELKVEPLPHPQNLPERGFWIGLACVALLHGSLVVGLSRSAPRQLGERDGSPDAISVEFVEPSALSARAQPTPEPSAPAALAAPATAAAQQPAEAAQDGATPPSEARADAPAPGPRPTPPSLEDLKTASLPPKESQANKESQEANESAAPKEAAAAKDTSTQPLLNPPAPPFSPLSPPGLAPPKPAVPPPGQAPAKLKPNSQLSLQLDLPNNFAAPSGLSTAAVRPPDITRSGENDEFGRRVIRALRQTMPPPRGELGRVTVRLLLSATGDLSELQLVRAAADAALTQSVVFAVKQSSFPIPPKGATLSDRTFLVTYIYN